MTSQQKEKKVRSLHAEGMSIRKISKSLRIGRHIVNKIIKEVTPSIQETSVAFSQLGEYREEIVRWAEEHRLTARLIHNRILERKVDISYSSLARFLKTLQKKEVYVPLITMPGEEAQVDFGYFGLFMKEEKKIKVWVFNMVLSYSRYAFYKIVTDQNISTFLKCHTEAFEFFKGVPASVKIDNLGAGVLEADFYEPSMQKRYAEFLAHYDTTAVTARICRGQDKGKVEAGIKYVKNNFLKSLVHNQFGQLSQDLSVWVKNQCNLRVHGTTKKIPHEQYLKIEKATLLSLPEERYKLLELEERKVNQYGHVYFHKNHYSVPHHYAGETVLLQSDGSTLKVFKETRLLAMHPVNLKAGQFITLENHKSFHKQLKTEAWYIEQAEQIGEHAVRILKLMQAERPFHWKHMMKGIFALIKVYCITLINKSCEQAIISGTHTYKKVRQYCEKGMHQEEPPPKEIKNVNGYYHDLSIYDQLVNK